jgi:DNA-binding transcriptional regulator WhiA
MRTYHFTNRQHEVLEASSLYQSGQNTYDIAKTMNKSRTLISLYLKSAGIVTRKGSSRTYSVDKLFFTDINTNEKAYWLGFLLADGHLDRKRNYIRLELQRQDEDHIRQFVKDVGSNAPIKQVTHKKKNSDKEYPSSMVSVCSSDLCHNLIDYGFLDFKNGISTRIVNSIHEEFLPSFLRGWFDADGSFLPATFSIIDMHLITVQWFTECLESKLGLKGKAKRYPNAHAFIFSSISSLVKFGDYIYSSHGPRLNRKYQKYLLVKNKAERTQTLGTLGAQETFPRPRRSYGGGRRGPPRANCRESKE